MGVFGTSYSPFDTTFGAEEQGRANMGFDRIVMRSGAGSYCGIGDGDGDCREL